MNKQSLFKILINALTCFLKNPLFLIPPSFLLIFITFLSKISVSINYKLTTSLALTIWLVFFSLISLLAISFVASGFIGLVKEKQNKAINIVLFFKYGKKYFLKNFIITIVILACHKFIQFMAGGIAFFIGKSLSFSPAEASIVFLLLYILGLIGVLIFFVYSSFILVIYKRNIKESIIDSFNIVKNNYLETLSILVISFILISFIEYLSFLIAEYFNLVISSRTLILELVMNLFIYPYILVLLTFYLTNRK